MATPGTVAVVPGEEETLPGSAGLRMTPGGVDTGVGEAWGGWRGVYGSLLDRLGVDGP